MWTSGPRELRSAQAVGLPPEPLERLGVRDLGVDVHRHVDLRTSQDPHGNQGIKAAVLRRGPAPRRASTRRHPPINQLIASAPQDAMHPNASWLPGR
jgi:hypothetical protein